MVGRLALRLFLCFTCGIFAVVILVRGERPTIILPEFPSTIGGMQCVSSYHVHQMYCWSKDVFAAVDNGLIVSATFTQPIRPLGDYLAAWGTPQGVLANSVQYRIYWFDKSVYVNALDIRAPVYMIAIGEHDYGRHWKGLVRRFASTDAAP